MENIGMISSLIQATLSIPPPNGRKRVDWWLTDVVLFSMID